MGASSHLLLPILLLLLSLLSTAHTHNITKILTGFPDYSLFNNYLTQTKLSDDINSRQTITCLVLTNATMRTLADKYPLSVIKNALRLLILLDYFDSKKLHDLSQGSALITTLYQTTGIAPGNFGFVNITLLKGGKVGFGSAAPGSNLSSTYTKSVKQIPYNISVLEISAPIIAPSILTAPAPPASDVNITELVEKAGCKTFASLIVSSGVVKIYESAVNKGLTVFAPTDEAFKAHGAPDLSKLTDAEVVTLLQFHALAIYAPIGTLKITKGPISTLATNGAGKYELTTTTTGDSVSLSTGVDTSRVSATVIDDTPLSIFTVNAVLLPIELFGNSPSPSPSPTPSLSPTPSPEKAKTPAPSAKTPPPSALSPPAPPIDSPEGSPAYSPEPAADSPSGSGSVSMALFKTLVIVFAALLG